MEHGKSYTQGELARILYERPGTFMRKGKGGAHIILTNKAWEDGMVSIPKGKRGTVNARIVRDIERRTGIKLSSGKA